MTPQPATGTLEAATTAWPEQGSELTFEAAEPSPLVEAIQAYLDSLG